MASRGERGFYHGGIADSYVFMWATQFFILTLESDTGIHALKGGFMSRGSAPLMAYTKSYRHAIVSVEHALYQPLSTEIKSIKWPSLQPSSVQSFPFVGI